MARQRYVDALVHGLYPVVHEVGHDKQVDDLGEEEAVSDVFGDGAVGSGFVVGVQL